MRKYLLVFIALSLVFPLAACGTPSNVPPATEPSALTETQPPTTEPTQPEPPDGINLTQLLAGTPVKITVEGSAILLEEDGMTVTMSTDSHVCYREGYVTAVLHAPPVLFGDQVYVEEAFVEDYLCGEAQSEPSLFRNCWFLPSEILAALDDPEGSAFNQKLLLQVLRPTSMGIDIPYVDAGRVFSYGKLEKMSIEIREDLEKLGYENVGDYTYTEYSILSGIQTLAQAGFTNIAKSYPELKGVDLNEMTVAEYEKWTSNWAWERSVGELTEKEKAFIEAKQLEISDYFQLKRVYTTSIFDQSDDTLRSTLEDFYNGSLSRVKNTAQNG